MNSSLKIVLLTLFLGVYLSSCCNCGKSVAEENTLQGVITIVGHEPFAKLAIRIDENTVYTLKCSKELQDVLWKEQGTLYYIKYSELVKDENLQAAVIEKAIPLKKNEKK